MRPTVFVAPVRYLVLESLARMCLHASHNSNHAVEMLRPLSSHFTIMQFPITYLTPKLNIHTLLIMKLRKKTGDMIYTLLKRKSNSALLCPNSLEFLRLKVCSLNRSSPPTYIPSSILVRNTLILSIAQCQVHVLQTLCSSTLEQVVNSRVNDDALARAVHGETTNLDAVLARNVLDEW
jgi:hypothetical protein